MIGRIEKTVLDCPDPRALAGFYAELLGMRVNEDDGDGAWQKDPGAPTARTLAAGPCTGADAADDIRVEDVESAEREVLRLGATLLAGERGTGFRVYADPAGHPFCLVY